MGYHQQELITWKPAPRGSKACPGACNNVGNCNYDSGLCECPAGWKGKDCKTVQKRPCTNLKRNPDDPNIGDDPLGFVDENGRDLNVLDGNSTTSRCFGTCDDAIGMCYCDGAFPHGRINAPKGSPPGSPPIRNGRPMTTDENQPRETKDGVRLKWGYQTYESVYGASGWCVADDPAKKLGCIIDGIKGPNCDQVAEHFCINQCNGHGSCYLGFCKCDPGWYGHDCARKKAGLALEPSRISELGWLRNTVVEAAAAIDPPPKPTRKRPLIYVYDLEPLYSQKMLQYRIPASWCVHRKYEAGNETVLVDNWVYAVDTLLHKMLLQSKHRTFDPEEADFFYVPQYSTCYIFPVHGWADYPWFGTPGLGLRVVGASVMINETRDWIDGNFPYWKRRGGRDHIWLFTHDEGSCWAPQSILTSIWLTHWGRLGLDHTSNTAFGSDNYNGEHRSKWIPEGWQKLMGKHACYDEKKDLVIPSFKALHHYHQSPLSGRAPKDRDLLLSFKGDVGRGRQPNYSRGVRQRLYKLAREQKWKEKYKVIIGDSRNDEIGDYSELLSRSKFCLVAPGDGWSARAEDSVLHGCVPVIIMDGVHVVFETILNWSSFSIRIPEKDIDKTVEILLAVPEHKLRSLQAHLSRVWHRFRYVKGPALSIRARSQLEHHLRETAGGEDLSSLVKEDVLGVNSSDCNPRKMESLIDRTDLKLPRPFIGNPSVDDAFRTILQWLYGRIQDKR